MRSMDAKSCKTITNIRFNQIVYCFAKFVIENKYAFDL